MPAGVPVEVTEVQVVKHHVEEQNEYELEDGAIIRVPNPATVVYRVEGPVDAEGNPGYLVKVGTSVTIVRGPRKLTEANSGDGGSS